MAKSSVWACHGKLLIEVSNCVVSKLPEVDTSIENSLNHAVTDLAEELISLTRVNLHLF